MKSTLSAAARKAEPAPPDPLVVTLTAAQLRALVIDAIEPLVADLLEGRQSRRLLDSSELSQALGVSAAQVGKLVRDGCPHVMAGACRRYDLDEVIAWLRVREGER